MGSVAQGCGGDKVKPRAYFEAKKKYRLQQPVCAECGRQVGIVSCHMKRERTLVALKLCNCKEVTK